MTDKRAVVVISSHVARGSVGNRAAVFALETLGFPVWAVPTVILPWHPGHGKATRIVPDPEQFRELLRDLGRSRWLAEIGGIVSGYLGDPLQAEAIAELVDTVKQANPEAMYLCDPIMGDSGRLYVPEETAAAIRTHLVPRADVLAPNRFELEWILGRALSGNEDLIDAWLELAPGRLLVTSAFGESAGATGNLLVSAERAQLATHRLIENAPNGLGDLTGAVFLARLLSGMDDEKALQSTTAAVYEILARTAKRGADELTLETDAASLVRPLAMVQMRRLAHPADRDRRA